MPTRSAKRKQAREQTKDKTLDKQKGDLLEDIAASLHRVGGVIAEPRQFLPSRRDPSKTREIDVLLTVAGGIHKLQFGVECKNWKGPVVLDDIAAFRDKLEDVGLPVRPSYYICVNGYTSGARRRAEEHGIELFTLEGLNAERVASEIHEAMQSLVFYVCWVEGVTILDDHPGNLDEISLEYYGPDDQPLGTPADILWELWISQQIPLVAGSREIDLPMPEGTYHLGGGGKTAVRRLLYSLIIQGNVLSIPGSARRHVLRGVIDNQEKAQAIEAESQPVEGNPTLLTFEDDSELSSYLRSRGAFKITGRIRVPRIVWLRRMYWPMSRRVVRMVKRDTDAFRRGDISEIPNYQFGQVEGPALITAWEPIWSGHFEGGEPISSLDEDLPGI